MRPVAGAAKCPVALPGADGPRHEVNPDRRGRDCMIEKPTHQEDHDDISKANTSGNAYLGAV